MTVEKITFMQTFPTMQFGNDRLGIEGTLEPGEDPIQAFMQAKEIVRQSFAACNPSLHYTFIGEVPLEPPPAIPKIINIQHERLGILIENSTSLEELEKYKPEVDKSNEPLLMIAYSNRYKSLQK
jgi:hypothetical protein